MRKKQYIILVIVLIIVVALVVILMAFNNKQEEEEEAAEEAATVYVTEFDAEDVVSFSYFYNYEQYTFELNDDGEWYYTEDDETTWDQDSITSMVEVLAGITADYTIESPEDESEYGLDSFYQLIDIELSDGTELELQFGAANEVLGGYYVKLADEDTVYLVDEDVYTTFVVDVYDLVADEEEEDEDTSDDTSDDTTEETADDTSDDSEDADDTSDDADE